MQCLQSCKLGRLLFCLLLKASETNLFWSGQFAHLNQSGQYIVRGRTPAEAVAFSAQICDNEYPRVLHWYICMCIWWKSPCKPRKNIPWENGRLIQHYWSIYWRWALTCHDEAQNVMLWCIIECKTYNGARAVPRPHIPFLEEVIAQLESCAMTGVPPHRWHDLIEWMHRCVTNECLSMQKISNIGTTCRFLQSEMSILQCYGIYEGFVRTFHSSYVSIHICHTGSVAICFSLSISPFRPEKNENKSLKLQIWAFPGV